ncbi:MAG: hypothetical protein AMS14_10690, partial [Planctomycetes bacterium DG_20]
RGGELVVQPVGESYLQCGSTLYRGRLHLKPAADKKFLIINHVDLESYLAGVLPKELYPAWSLETYRALAVAARTFAMYHRKHIGSGRDFDLGADTASQVYGGFSAETDKSWRAVQSTHGVVLAYGSEGDRRIFLAQYSSCCGGIVNPAKVLRNVADIEPLRGGQRCEDCQFSRQYRWPPVRVAKLDIFVALKGAYGSKAEALGGVKAVRVASRTDYGRALWLDVVGSRPGSNLRIRAEDLRLALLRSGVARARKLHSMNCKIRDLGALIEFRDGRGFGHGVGLCQYGAEGKARRGWSAEQILEFYYPGSPRPRWSLENRGPACETPDQPLDSESRRGIIVHGWQIAVRRHQQAPAQRTRLRRPEVRNGESRPILLVARMFPAAWRRALVGQALVPTADMSNA